MRRNQGYLLIFLAWFVWNALGFGWLICTSLHYSFARALHACSFRLEWWPSVGLGVLLVLVISLLLLDGIVKCL